MDSFSLKKYLHDNNIKLTPGLLSLKIPSLGCLKWFETGSIPPGSPKMQPLRKGNLVTQLIDGEDTFESMHEALLTATEKDHYIYLIGWWLDDDLKLVENKAESTIQAIFEKASENFVQIRAMLWYQHFDTGWQNYKEVERINKLKTGAAICDSRHLKWGSHHQKILVVKGTKGLIAFCGGVDIHPDRVTWGVTSDKGAPYHDVHCKISGPAAYDILNIFIERWMDHPEHIELDKNKGELLGKAESVPSPIGSRIVQIGRTYGNARNNNLEWEYTFAPNGEQTASRIILKAISEARRFIYIEDQYLVDKKASEALQKALQNIEHLTILIPDGSITNLPQVNFRRKEFISPLKEIGGEKVRVFKLKESDPHCLYHFYVHSKTYIIDDKFAIIGSANCNRRSWTNDSEVVAGIYDPMINEQFARQLRIELWAEHLNLSKSDDRLADGVKSADLWLNPPQGRYPVRIERYNEDKDIEVFHPDFIWELVDPDGS